MDQDIYEFHQRGQFAHWWFRGRSEVIRHFLALLSFSKPIQSLDIGSGYGAIVPALSELGAVDAIEPHRGAMKTLRSLGVRKVYAYKNFPRAFPQKRYDLVSMADVLEHIEDDSHAVKTVSRSLLRPGGYFLVTVPAYQWLWSDHDVRNRHYRRYTKRMLVSLLRGHGFAVERASYFISALLPLGILSRILPFAAGKEMGTPPAILNRLFTAVVSFEARIAPVMPLPFGLSVIALARKVT